MHCLFHDKRGSVAALTGIMMPVLIGFMALGAETGLWLASERKASHTADVAAYSSAAAYMKGLKSKEAIKLNAQNVVTNAGWGTPDVAVVTQTPEELGTDEIEVRITRTIPRYLTRVFWEEPVVVLAVSRVRVDPGGPVCVLGLHPTAASAIKAWGSATLDLKGCSLHANSTSATAIANDGSATIRAKCASTVGKTNTFKRGELECGRPRWNRPVMNDPFADKADPAGQAVRPFGQCQTLQTSSGLTFLTPGTCKGAMQVSGTLHLLPGVYEFKARLDIKGIVQPLPAAELAALNLVDPMDGTTLVFTKPGVLDFTEQGKLTFDPPLTGPAAGIALWGRGKDVLKKMTGGNSIDTQGLVYLPNSDIVWRGGSAADSEKCLRLVASTIDFSGDSELLLSCDPSNAYLSLVDLQAQQRIAVTQ